MVTYKGDRKEHLLMCTCDIKTTNGMKISGYPKNLIKEINKGNTKPPNAP
jgi:hypothetical protein